ncbi:MAG: hypothetical protein NWP80_01095, partial [Candidatus Gracilibacteria bacterium]|nr:hypothetical protein [Candidatus Gracilibacteria bacterium]
VFLLLIFLSVFAYFFSGEYIYFLCSVIFVMTSRDLFNTNSYGELNNIADKNKINPTKLIGFSYILGVVIAVLLLPFFGLIADDNLIYFTYFLMFLITVIFFYFLIINYKEFKTKTIVKFEKFKTPKTVYLQSLLSALCGITVFFGVRFLFPVFLYSVAVKYGLDKNIFSIIGIFAGIIALLNLISKKEINLPKNKDLMINNYLLYVFCRFLFGILFYVFLQLDNKIFEYIIIFFVIILNIIMEYSSKIWSIGFIQTLKEQSHFYQKDPNKVNLTYNSYLSTFVIFKALGGALAFGIAYLLYFILNLEIILIIFSVISIIYGIYIKKYFNNLPF